MQSLMLATGHLPSVTQQLHLAAQILEMAADRLDTEGEREASAAMLECLVAVDRLALTRELATLDEADGNRGLPRTKPDDDAARSRVAEIIEIFENS